jgi:class 3 adenylate cyclase
MQATELANLNRTLEERVQQQVDELERAGRLRRFLSPQLADLIISSGDERALDSHRREITVVFCDLRGFTAFAETSDPEDVMGVLREYHAALGELIFEYEGTLERFTGDGVMVFFNDPVPCPDPPARAVRMAVGMRERVAELSRRWRRRGHELGFGMGVAVGYATLGRIGFEGRFDYGAIGTVTNMSARLCDKAQDGQILITDRVYAMIEDLVEVEPVESLELKGFHRSMPAYNVVRFKDSPLAQDWARGEGG